MKAMNSVIGEDHGREKEGRKKKPTNQRTKRPTDSFRRGISIARRRRKRRDTRTCVTRIGTRIEPVCCDFIFVSKKYVSHGSSFGAASSYLGVLRVRRNIIPSLCACVSAAPKANAPRSKGGAPFKWSAKLRWDTKMRKKKQQRHQNWPTACGVSLSTVNWTRRASDELFSSRCLFNLFFSFLN